MVGVGQDGVRDGVRKDLSIPEPGFVTEERIRAGTNDGNSVIREVFQEILEGANFGRSDEGEVKRVCVQHIPFVLEVLAADRLLFAVHIRRATPGGRWLTYNRHSVSPCVRQSD